MRKYGLIGYPLGHSFSKGYFSEKFKNENIKDTEYNNYPLDPVEQFPSLIKDNTELLGLNVTIPYKQEIIQFLDELDDIALAIGAVNTIKIIRDKEKYYLKGYNTDYYGFEESLKPLLRKNHQKALILGTGGASKAVAYVLDNLGISYRYVSRSPNSNKVLSYSKITSEIIGEYHLIINTSPLGMYPDINDCPDIPYKSLSKNHILYDLIYNPEKTLFLQKGIESHSTIVNGLPMLHLQAEKAWTIWNS
jgi:shikimate dehydrogenase